MSGTPALELVGVGLTYPATPPVQALVDVTLTVARGEMVAIVGPSGSGKSTLLALAGALDRPMSGSVRIAGNDMTRMGDARLSALRAQAIGLVFQQFMLLPGQSALANVATGLLYHGISARQRRERALRALERVGLADRASHRPAQLSGGEQQRVAIARAIVSEPALVLADEPTGNLDSATSQVILEHFRVLNGDGTTIVLVSHDPALAGAVPRVVGLRDGRVESDSATGGRE